MLSRGTDPCAAENAGRVEIRWRAYELRPAPVPTLDPGGPYLTDIWERAVYPMAEQRGMQLRLPAVQPRSRAACEAAEFAREHAKFAEMHHAIFRAFFEEGVDIGAADNLAAIAMSLGLNGDLLGQSLHEEKYRARVLDDEQLAESVGISGVPAILVRGNGDGIERARMISGAQPYENLAAAVEHAISRRASSPAVCAANGRTRDPL